MEMEGAADLHGRLALFRALPRLIELDDVGLLPALEDEVYHFDPGALHVVQDSIHAGVEVSVSDHAGNRDGEPGGGGEERLVNSVRDLGGTGEPARVRHAVKCLDQAGDRSEQAEQW